jgi:flagellar basal body rod protein FlgG
MRELAELAQVRRAFELNNKVIQTADEVLQGVNQLRRKM